MNTDRISKKSAFLFLAATISAIAATALRCVNLFLFFDSDIGYYTSGAVMPTVFNLFLVASVIFFIIYSFTGEKPHTMEYRAPSAISKVLLIVPAILSASLIALNVPKVSSAPLYLALVAISVLAVFYFISDLLKLSISARALLNILLVILLTLLLAFSYFDQNVQMNAPDKILFGLACISGMLFTVSELKLVVGTPRPAIYHISVASTILFGSASSIPSIIAHHAGRSPKQNGLYYEYYFILAMAIYAAIRLFTEFSSKSGKPLYISDIESNAEADVEIKLESDDEKNVESSSSVSTDTSDSE